MNKIFPSFFGSYFFRATVCQKLILFITRYFSVSNANIILLSMLSSNVLQRFSKMKIN